MTYFLTALLAFCLGIIVDHFWSRNIISSLEEDKVFLAAHVEHLESKVKNLLTLRNRK